MEKHQIKKFKFKCFKNACQLVAKGSPVRYTQGCLSHSTQMKIS